MHASPNRHYGDATREITMSATLKARLRGILDQRDQAKARVDGLNQQSAMTEAREATARAANRHAVAQAVPEILAPIIQEVREELTPRGLQVRPSPPGYVAPGQWSYEYEVFSTTGEQLPPAKLRFSFAEPREVRVECTGGRQIDFGGRAYPFVKIALADFTGDKACELFGSYLQIMLEIPARVAPGNRRSR
jgi:hypothetical protein